MQSVSSRRHRGTAVGVTAALVLLATTANATPEGDCQAGRYKAAGEYVACHQKAVAKFYAGGDNARLVGSISKCREKYVRKWVGLSGKASGSGSSCDAGIYVDNGDGTVTDRLTGLQWEQKTNDNGIHDRDNTYTWSATPPNADGTAFTVFLDTLKSGCFAGYCDWRMPTFDELSTIVAEPCDTGGGIPCLAPIFGEGSGGDWWSFTTMPSLLYPDQAWKVNFSFGDEFPSGKGAALYVRAVRGGL